MNNGDDFPEFDVHRTAYKRTWSLVEQLRRSGCTDEWERISDDIEAPLISYWDVDPHSAMEALEQTVLSLPVDLARPLVCRVVSGWKRNPSYSPDAGGNADHCYLSALILSDNYQLADRDWARLVLPRTLKKETRYRNESTVRDYGRKRKLVRVIQDAPC